MSKRHPVFHCVRQVGSAHVAGHAHDIEWFTPSYARLPKRFTRMGSASKHSLPCIHLLLGGLERVKVYNHVDNGSVESMVHQRISCSIRPH